MQELENVKMQVAMVLMAAVQVPGIERYAQAYDDVMAMVLVLNRADNAQAQSATLRVLRARLETMERLGDFMQPAYDAIDAMEAVL